MTSPIVTEDAFHKLVSRRSSELLALAAALNAAERPERLLTRPLLAKLLGQASLIEELLDAYGARNNQTWLPLRSLAAAVRLFAGVHHELLHIQHARPSYRLLAIEEDFDAATAFAAGFTGAVLLKAAGELVELGRRLKLPIEPGSVDAASFSDGMPPGRLPRDRVPRPSDEGVSQTVTRLATAFLNLAAASELLHATRGLRPAKYAACIPDPISEESLRTLQDRFHSLQSRYDTYVSDTQTEQMDEDLLVLRGHVSVIYHLLSVATELAHYYQRHVDSEGARRAPQSLVDGAALLATLMDYAIAFAWRYLGCARSLCQSMLKRYTTTGRVEAPVPRYRGFHVRPATLVAKIVRHYGSEVAMELEGECYDAASPLDIFRANEKINARKRRWLAEEISGSDLLAEGHPADPQALIRHVVLTLAERGRLVLYEQPLKIERVAEAATPLELVVRELAQLQAAGKIDIETNLTVSFVGDMRVLNDLELLANSGYGEDNFGNNAPLPKQLAYLRQADF